MKVIAPNPAHRRVDWSHRFLLFISVETRRRRRALVIGFYLFFVAFAVLFLWWKGFDHYDHLAPLSLFLSAMLGGLMFTGPVRLFSQWQLRLRGVPDSPSDLAGLRLSNGGQTVRPQSDLRLDEHDIARRDRAHYLAYSTLRWPAMFAVYFGLIFYMDWSPAQFAHVLFVLAPPIALLFFSLPQAIILWTEPELDPDPEEESPQTVVRIVP